MKQHVENALFQKKKSYRTMEVTIPSTSLPSCIIKIFKAGFVHAFYFKKKNQNLSLNVSYI